MSRWYAALLLPGLLLGAGCTPAGTQPPPGRAAAPAPFADCGALTAPPAATPRAGASIDPAATSRATIGPAAGPSAAVVDPQPLPDLDLPCFTGGEPVRLRSLRGPAVINLWASWCAPCRKELPAVQRLAERTGGQLHVVGVNTRDDRAAAQDLAADLGLTFPTLFDPGETLRLKLERVGLPMTLFVDGQGRIRYLHDTGVLDDRSLPELVTRHLGVAVPS